MKALYLDGSRGIEVRLDGPALRVRRPARADGQYPLQRVSRVVALGTIQWHGDALGACLSQRKPVAVLDGMGRFVRLWFRASVPVYGLIRHLGSLLGVPRFLARYDRWFSGAERGEMIRALEALHIECGSRHPDMTWQVVCFNQYLRHNKRVGGSHRFLSGLAAAQISSALCANGVPHDPLSWGRQEYRLFSDMMRLERWRQAVLLDQLMERFEGSPERRDLVEAFEGMSQDRERRIESWRHRALLAMMGLDPEEMEGDCDQSEWRQELLDRLCQRLSSCSGNLGQIPFGTRQSLRTSVRILREYLRSDRRAYESYRTA
ncbi:MAG: hypothetical protein GXY47_07465 [Acidobacteria bacterium]|nr:hypothetical protein [Acidobacteriota bacterium]